MNQQVRIGSIWKERDSRFTRYLKVIGIGELKATVVSSSIYPTDFYGWDSKITRIKLANFGKRYSHVRG